MILDIKVPGKPVGKGRPRFAKAGRFVRVYTDEKTATWEDRAARAMRIAYVDGHGLASPLDEPVTVTVAAVCKRPGSRPAWMTGEAWRARWKDGARVVCCSKPDVDNVAKAVMDALTLAGVLTDDTRVVRLAATKEYAAAGEQEHVAVTVRRWEAA